MSGSFHERMAHLLMRNVAGQKPDALLSRSSGDHPTRRPQPHDSDDSDDSDDDDEENAGESEGEHKAEVLLSFPSFFFIISL
jgi:hypothetical protein